jgi:hypothetical protein
MKAHLVNVALVAVIVLAVAQPTFGRQQREPLPTANFYSKSLHYTNKGIEFIVSKEHGGLELLTGMTAEQLGCIAAGCHATSCDVCHMKTVNGKSTYSTDTTTVIRACHRCHGEMEKDSPDVHFAKGMSCVQCHAGKEIHGDGIEHKTYMEPGFDGAKCESCHTTTSSSRSHTVHKGKISCDVCHTAETVTCFNCHIDTRLALKKDVQIPLKNMFWLINHDGKVKLANMLSYVYKNKTMITFAPAYFHTIKKEGKKCQECHGTKIVMDVKKNDIHPVWWEKGEMKGTAGVIPVVDGLNWNLVYCDYKDTVWIPLKNPEKPLLNYSGFCTPLTAAQLAKLAVAQKE